MEKLVAYEPDGREEGWLTPASNGEWYRRSDVDQRIAKLEAEKSLFDARLREMRRALDDTDEMRVQAEAKLGRLEKEAWSTVNELRGSLGAYENELRTIMGNTNFHCLEFRRDNLAHILSDQPKVLAVQEVTSGYTLLSTTNAERETVVFCEVWDGGTVIVLGKEDE